MHNKQFAVLGLGRFGMSVAKSLTDNGYTVMVADRSEEKVQEASEFVTYAVKADVSDEMALRSLGLGNFDVVVVAIGTHLEDSVMAVLIAKELGVPYVLAKAQTDMQKKILEKIGADRVVFPEREMGVWIANNLIYSSFLEFIEVSEEYGIVEVKAIPEWIGKTLAESDIRAKYGFNVVGIRRHGKMEASPAASWRFEEDDIVIILGETQKIQRFSEKNAKDS